MYNFPKQAADKAIGGPRPVVCSKTGRLHGSEITPTLVDELRPYRSNPGICALGPKLRHSRRGLAGLGLAHEPFVPLPSTALLSASSDTLQGSVSPQCSLLLVQASLRRASRPGRDQSQIPVRTDSYSHSMRLPSTGTCQSGSACHFTLNDKTLVQLQAAQAVSHLVRGHISYINRLS